MKDQSITSTGKIGEQTNRQLNLFKSISNLDEHTSSIDDLLGKAVEITSKGWINSDSFSAVIEFDNKKFQSSEFKETKYCLTATTSEKFEKDLSLKIISHNEYSFSQHEQDLAEVIAGNLAVKVSRIISNKELQEKQELLDKAYKLAHIGTWEYDMLNDHLQWSTVTKEVHGFEDDYIPDVESTVNLFKEGFNRDTFAEAANNAIQHEIPFDVELKIISGKGDERWIRATAEPEYKDGVCIRFYGISQNVTERRQAEEEIELNDRRFKALVQHGMDMIGIVDEEANYLFVSPTSYKILGLKAEDFIGKNAFEFIHEDDVERILRQFTNLSSQETTQLKPFRFKNSEGNWRWLESTITNLTNDPAVKGYVTNSRDITERQIKQEEIIDSLKEKETLLAEIHHRIKNNLSVLTGLLQLQAAKENNKEVLDRLFDSVARIHTMASIHEQLYQSNNFSNIEFADRIQLLALNIQKAFQVHTDVKMNFQCESVILSINQALTISLITNEVLTNIFKHAFSENDGGKITIELKQNEEKEKVSLIISDDGKGLPEDFNPKKSGSLGLTLIHMLAEQLKAEYSFISDKKGTTFSLLFKIK